MRNFLLVFVEIAYAVLQHPGELPVYLRRIPNLRAHVLLSVFLAAFSVALGVYTLRDNYAPSFFLTVLILSVVHFFLIFVYGILQGALVDAFVYLEHPERSGQAWQMVGITLLSFLPLVLFLPTLTPLQFLALNLLIDPRPMVVFPALGLGFWQIIVVVKGLQYLYELTLRSAIQIYVKSVLIVAVFPGLVVFFTMFEIWQLIS